ncbi:lipopolysaccharide biosynthesis protein [Rhodobacter ferrooxidans]|nr:oligosaccharide flippase family protein [Rhodobacter sp. SW2]
MRDVLTGAALAFVLRGLGAGLAFALNVVIARMLGAEGSGLYFLALSLTMILSVIARLGLDNTLLRFVAAAASRQDWGRVKGVQRLGMRVAMAAGLGLSLLCYALARPVSEGLLDLPGLATPLRWMSFSVLTYSAMSLLAESLKGLKHVRDSMLVSGVLYPLFALVLVWPSIRLFGTEGASLAYALATGLSALTGWLMWKAALAPQVEAAKPFPISEMWASCRPLWVVTVVNGAVVPWLPLLLLGYWGSAEDVGILGAATRLVTVLTFFLVAVNTVLSPKISALAQDGEFQTLGRIVRQSAFMVMLAASPVFAVFLLFGAATMSVFGPDFAQGGGVLMILTAGQLVASFLGPGGFVLALSGWESKVRTAALISAVSMIFLSLVLIPQFGMTGAALASSAGLVIDRIGGAYLTRKHLGFHSLAIPEILVKRLHAE